MSYFEPDTKLYHVGCGRPLFTIRQLQEAKGGMALACRCGANAPIVVADLQDGNVALPSLPASLVQAILRRQELPHLEYYLGFSDFDCPAKRSCEESLRSRGAISLSECAEEKCREAHRHQRARYRSRLFRIALLESAGPEETGEVP